MKLLNALCLLLSIVLHATGTLALTLRFLPPNLSLRSDLCFWLLICPAVVFHEAGIPAPNLWITEGAWGGSTYGVPVHYLTTLGVMTLYIIPGLLFLWLFLRSRARRIREETALK